jgi:DNA-binding transcriptional regulator YdaS (Cro superfamily)
LTIDIAVLYDGFMKLHDYLQIPGNQAKLAAALNKSTAQVWQWKSGLRPVPLELCMPIEAATDKQVTRQELRPDDFALIWPDLAAQEA